MENKPELEQRSALFMDAMFRIGIIAVLLYFCARIIAPFLALMLWALILAVALYPLHQRLSRRLGGKQGRASVLMVLTGMLVIIVPVGMLANSMAEDFQGRGGTAETSAIHIAPPDPAVADWPVIGEKTYQAWSAASDNLPEFKKTYAVQLKAISDKAVSAAGNAATGVLLFLGSLIIAGIMMAYGEGGNRAMIRIFNRFAGSGRGTQLHSLSVATVRSVAAGVIGVAAFQSVLFGIGFIFTGIPFPGLLALAVLLTGIVQMPAVIFALPAIIYLWTGGDGSITFNIIFTAYFVVAGLSDNVLKPLLLGRGVEAPLPVILIGALGGMISAGFIGLFIGAVLLAVAYQVFMAWVDSAEESSDIEAPATEPGSS